MNDATPVVPDVVEPSAGKQEPKPTQSKAKAKTPVALKKTAKKPLPKKAAMKAQARVRKPSPKKAAKKAPAKRRAFPYLRVLNMWKQGNTLEQIAKATGRYQRDASDPVHGFRVALTRFHAGVRIDGKLVKLPHRVSKRALKLATKAGKKAAA